MFYGLEVDAKFFIAEIFCWVFTELH